MIEGTILPLPTATSFTREAWCELVATRPEFRRPQPVQTRNPFTGETVTLSPATDSAEVLLDSVAVGRAWWSMSDDPLVNISVEPEAIPLVREWATLLAGEFREDLPARVLVEPP